jgi:hypothetical protein
MGSDDQAQLLAGETMSYWRGIGLMEDRLFIGANQRGILHLAPGDSKAALHPVADRVLDLVVPGSRIIALVETGDSPDTLERFIAVLSYDPGTKTLTEEARHPLAVRIDSLSL